MGTRSLTVIREGWEATDTPTDLVAIYRQFDGYPEEHGKDLANFVDGLTITNGIGAETGRTANGSGCIAAQLVHELKTDVGNIYLQANNRDCGAEYVYTIDVFYNAPMMITVEQGYGEEWTLLFEGGVEKFQAFVKKAIEG